MKTFIKHNLHEGIVYHLENEIPLAECVYRPHSKSFYNFFIEARKLFKEGIINPSNYFDKDLLETDIGEHDIYEGRRVPLDIPMLEGEEKDVELNKPQRGGPKKFYVYVKDGDKVKKVTFGDTSGLAVNFDDKEARKSFAARHQCHLKNDKTKAGYWSCRLPRYANELGLKNGGSFFW
ncbi:hypothetical protein OAA24_00885 [bacterium]|jgi:hypothetical protein|nr:hypothetical protein [bacterium]